MARPNRLRCRCSVCALSFNSPSAFDKHRVGDFGAAGRRCRSPDEMRAAGMATNGAGCWITEKRPFPPLGDAHSQPIGPDGYQGSALPPRLARATQRAAETAMQP